MILVRHKGCSWKWGFLQFFLGNISQTRLFFSKMKAYFAILKINHCTSLNKLNIHIFCDCSVMKAFLAITFCWLGRSHQTNCMKQWTRVIDNGIQGFVNSMKMVPRKQKCCRSKVFPLAVVTLGALSCCFLPKQQAYNAVLCDRSFCSHTALLQRFIPWARVLRTVVPKTTG